MTSINASGDMCRLIRSPANSTIGRHILSIESENESNDSNTNNHYHNEDPVIALYLIGVGNFIGLVVSKGPC